MKYYPDSQVELQGFAARHYDTVLNTMSFGLYSGFINKAIQAMEIKPEDKILDLGAGTGRNAMLMSKYLSDAGKIVGLEISDEMIQQFEQKFKDVPNITVLNKRIDKPFDLGEKFDKVFISFVIHGFPHEVRSEVIKNAFNNLKDGGEFIILDFNEFIVKEMPFLYRKIFTTFECKYAFDYVERDWKAILSEYGFGDFSEKLFFKNYVRLLKAKKTNN
jgi:demethylmenaquinone methyltransferase/2-methoxy-6-polyprenyl-1,4-benzoquinol methylase